MPNQNTSLCSGKSNKCFMCQGTDNPSTSMKRIVFSYNVFWVEPQIIYMFLPFPILHSSLLPVFLQHCDFLQPTALNIHTCNVVWSAFFWIWNIKMVGNINFYCTHLLFSKCCAIYINYNRFNSDNKTKYMTIMMITNVTYEDIVQDSL